jgi:hypothetical protein
LVFQVLKHHSILHIPELQVHPKKTQGYLNSHEIIIEIKIDFYCDHLDEQ